MPKSEDDLEVLEVCVAGKPRKYLQRSSAPIRPTEDKRSKVDLTAGKRRRHREIKKAATVLSSDEERPDTKPATRQKQETVTLDMDEEDDRVVETCRAFEEAFFGVPKREPELLELQRAQVPSRNGDIEALQASCSCATREEKRVSERFAPKLCKPKLCPYSEGKAPLCTASASASSSSSSSVPVSHLQRSSVPELKSVDLPQELSLPLPEDIPPVLSSATRDLQQDGGLDAKQGGPDAQMASLVDMLINEEKDLATSAVPEPTLSEVYVERMRVSSLADQCCACWQPINVGQLRLGYLPTIAAADGGLPAVRWLHVPRCVTRDCLRVDHTEWVAFGPSISDDDKDRTLAVLGLLPPSLPARDAEHPILRCRRWLYGPAKAQGWSRFQPLSPGASRPVLRPSEPAQLSAAAREARLMLASTSRARLQRRLDVIARRRDEQDERNERRVADRHNPGGQSDRNARTAATLSQRRVEAEAARLQRLRNRRGAARRHVGGLTKELRQAAPVLRLDRDGDPEEPCVICHEALFAGEEVRRLPCLHMFHRSCIDRWLRVKAVCPLDKLSVDELLANQRRWRTS